MGKPLDGQFAQCQLAFEEILRLIGDGKLAPQEALTAYHGVLERLGIPAARSAPAAAKSDCGCGCGGKPSGCGGQQPEPMAAAEANGTVAASKATAAEDASAGSSGKTAAASTGGKPDFQTMTPAEKLAWNRARLDRVFGAGQPGNGQKRS